MWIDHGQIRLHGGIEEVVRAYEGPDAGNHVATVLREMEAERTMGTERELERNQA
jgi:ABC-2 type transport system ATP-binding protein